MMNGDIGTLIQGGIDSKEVAGILTGFNSVHPAASSDFRGGKKGERTDVGADVNNGVTFLEFILRDCREEQIMIKTIFDDLLIGRPFPVGNLKPIERSKGYHGRLI